MSHNTNTDGSGGLSAFDQLPLKVREALANFPLNMSAEFALKLIKAGQSPNSVIAKLMANVPKGYTPIVRRNPPNRMGRSHPTFKKESP